MATLSDIASRCLLFPAELFNLCPSQCVYHCHLTCKFAVTQGQHESAMANAKRPLIIFIREVGPSLPTGLS